MVLTHSRKGLARVRENHASCLTRGRLVEFLPPPWPSPSPTPPSLPSLPLDLLARTRILPPARHRHPGGFAPSGARVDLARPPTPYRPHHPPRIRARAPALGVVRCPGGTPRTRARAGVRTMGWDDSPGRCPSAGLEAPSGGINVAFTVNGTVDLPAHTLAVSLTCRWRFPGPHQVNNRNTTS